MNRITFQSMCSKRLFYCLSLFAILLSDYCQFNIFAESTINSTKGIQSKEDEKILQEYIQAQGENTIVFDSSNIKMFWTDHSIVKQTDCFNILQTKKDNTFKSIPLKIQLANVIETMDCRIDFITKDSDIAFSVFDNKSKTISYAPEKNDFISYHIYSASLHLEDTDNFCFSIITSSKTTEIISVKKIVLSFSANNKSTFSGSPGFNQLIEEFKKSGINIPNSEIQILLQKSHDKLYIKIPEEMASDGRFFYHIYPVSREHIEPERINYSFNNHDFSLKQTKITIPKPYNTESKYVIIQRQIPPYPISHILIGQFNKNGRIWEYKIENIN